MSLDVEERARRYLAAMPGGIEGQRGSVDTVKAAVAMRVGFLLDERSSLRLLEEVHNPKCSPPWSRKDLLHKIRNGAAKTNKTPGYLLRDDEREGRVRSYGEQHRKQAVERLDALSYHNISTRLLELCPLDGDDEVRDYLDRRGLFVAAARFGCGAVPRGQAAVVEALTETFSWEALKLGDFVCEWEQRPVLDRLRHPYHRLILPWRNRHGQVTALQRRRLDAREPRYVFPRNVRPEDPFGAHLPQKAERVAFTEGALDAMALSILASRDEPTDVLGIPGASGWVRAWAGYGTERTALVALDADKAGDETAALMAADLMAAGASEIRRMRPAGASDWAAMMERAA